MSIQPQFALILGVSSGFGAAAARALSDAGLHILGVHLDRAAGLKAAQELQSEIEAKGKKAIFFNVNAADEQRRAEVVASIKQEIEQSGGNIKILLHSLAFGSLREFVSQDPALQLTQKQIEMTMDVMANSLIYWTQDIVHAGLMGENGRIVGLTSAGSFRALPMYGAVSGAKAAMETYVRQLALELVPWKITANAIRAGVTHTAALSKIPGNEFIMKNAYMRNPYHRLTTPEDVANVLKLLIQPEANWINGTILGVDGGEDSIDLTWWQPEE